MYYRLIQLFVIGCSISHLVESHLIVNSLRSNKIVCYSCKGSNCKNSANKGDRMIACNEQTQLCWAGFIDNKPYRGCANRYCTPNGISLDSEVRIDVCCRSNLCNNISLSLAEEEDDEIEILLQSTQSTQSSTVPTTTRITTTTKINTTTTTLPKLPEVYFVQEVDNRESKPLLHTEQNYEDIDTHELRPHLDLSNPNGFKISWEHIPYYRNFDNPAVSLSKILTLLMPVFLVLLL